MSTTNTPGILILGDTQSSAANLHKLDLARQRILSLVREGKVAAIIHTGDVKEVYNPVDQRVTNYWVRFLQELSALGVETHILLGNHDRNSIGDGADDWFCVFDGIGGNVFTYTEPVHTTVLGCPVAFAPFKNDKDVTRDFLRLPPLAPGGLLIFHDELKGCSLSATSRNTSDTALRVSDLNAKEYAYCLGGHIHMRQCVKRNVYYVGSPFAMDWGEVNQAHGYALYQPSTSKLTFHSFGIPGYYDPDLPGFDEAKPNDWQGAEVRYRVHAERSSPDLPSLLKAAEEKCMKLYPGCTPKVHLEPLGDVAAAIDTTRLTSDEECVGAYLKAHTPVHLTGEDKRLQSYLLQRLEQTAALARYAGEVQFLDVEATNVLTYEHIKIDYRQPGIQVVTGINYDWQESSNGSGKTSYLQLPVLAFFGRTMKGQENDAWKRDTAGPKDKATIRFRFRLGDGRIGVIERGRTPQYLRLLINDEDVSSGLGKAGTQKRIEQLTGFTWHLFTSTMYIDQSEVNLLLAGDDTKRKLIFAQLLNLERFGRAREIIGTDLTKTLQALTRAQVSLESLRQEREQLRKFKNDLGTTRAASKLQGDLESHRKAQERALTRYNASKPEALQASKMVKLLSGKVEDLVSEFAATEQALNQVLTAISKLKKSGGNCTVCGQPLPKATGAATMKELLESSEKLSHELGHLKVDLKAAKVERQKAQTTLEELTTEREELRGRLQTLEHKIETCQLEVLRATKQAELREEYATKEVKTLEGIKLTRQYIRDLEHDKAFLTFAKVCFSKDGLPVYMAATLCPRLNKAATYYSELFCEGQISVEFTLKDGDIDVAVHNVSGSATLKGQSRGETRMASLIVSFAVRDVVHTCPLLIADEPGDGLDERNARLFARGLQQAAPRFHRIQLTSHNQQVLVVLASEMQTVIEKRNKVSRIL